MVVWYDYSVAEAAQRYYDKLVSKVDMGCRYAGGKTFLRNLKLSLKICGPSVRYTVAVTVIGKSERKND